MKLITIAALTATLLISGCSDATSNQENNTTQTQKSIATKSGLFIDAAVNGLNYTCSSSKTMFKTDETGKFTCNENDTISFYLANNFIASSQLDNIISPKTLFANDNEAAINLAQLLQTLDSDTNPENSITIDIQKEALLTDKALDFSSDSFDDDLEIYLSEALVNEEAASQHMDNSLSLYQDDTSSEEASVIIKENINSANLLSKTTKKTTKKTSKTPQTFEFPEVINDKAVAQTPGEIAVVYTDLIPVFQNDFECDLSYEDTNFIINVAVKNRGKNSLASESTVSIILRKQDGSMLILNKEVESLDAGSTSQELHFIVPSDFVDFNPDWEYTIVIDSENVVTESNEVNNVSYANCIG